jgi:hypothetical protein
MFKGVERGRCIGLTNLSPSVSRFSRQCGILNISRTYRPSRPVTGIVSLCFVLLLLSSPYHQCLPFPHSVDSEERVYILDALSWSGRRSTALRLLSARPQKWEVQLLRNRSNGNSAVPSRVTQWRHIRTESKPSCVSLDSLVQTKSVSTCPSALAAAGLLKDSLHNAGGRNVFACTTERRVCTDRVSLSPGHSESQILPESSSRHIRIFCLRTVRALDPVRAAIAIGSVAECPKEDRETKILHRER